MNYLFFQKPTRFCLVGLLLFIQAVDPGDIVTMLGITSRGLLAQEQHENDREEPALLMVRHEAGVARKKGKPFRAVVAHLFAIPTSHGKIITIPANSISGSAGHFCMHGGLGIPLRC